MDIDEIFKDNGYYNLLENKDDDIFLQYLIEINDIPEELLGIYQSHDMDEIFIVYYIEPAEFENKCYEWDNKIMFLLNHSRIDKELLRKLKLNVVQILLYDRGKEVDKTIERSLDITREIMIPIDRNVEDINNERIFIDKEDIYLLPFVRIRKNSQEQNTDLYNSLEILLPIGEEYFFMANRINKKYNRNQNQGSNQSIMSLEDKQFKLLEEWIKNDN